MPTQHHIAPQIAHLAVPISALHHFVNNPRQGDIGAIAQSLQFFGQFRALVVNKRTNVVLCGNHTLAAMRALGWEQAAVTYVDVDDEQAARLVLADNRSSDLATNDASRLADLLQSLPSLDGTLYDAEALDALLADLEGAAARERTGDPEAVPQLPEQVTSQAGDIWMLGTHRLAVGDCTDAGLLDRLFGAERAAITLTSPPYNVAKDSHLPGHEKYVVPDERSAADWLELLVRFTTLALAHSDYVFCNLQSLAPNKVALIAYLSRCAGVYADTLIWDKLNAEPAMNKRCLNSRFEYVHVFSRDASRAIGTKEFWGTLDNVLALSSRADKDHAGLHKATYPVAFADHFVQNFCNPGELVFDPFAGTGTTIISCENNGRRCLGVEIVPAYADVAVQRWEEVSGQKAVRG